MLHLLKFLNVLLLSLGLNKGRLASLGLKLQMVDVRRWWREVSKVPLPKELLEDLLLGLECRDDFNLFHVHLYIEWKSLVERVGHARKVFV